MLREDKWVSVFNFDICFLIWVKFCRRGLHIIGQLLMPWRGRHRLPLKPNFFVDLSVFQHKGTTVAVKRSACSGNATCCWSVEAGQLVQWMRCWLHNGCIVGWGQELLFSLLFNWHSKGEVKRQEREANHSRLSSAEDRNGRSCYLHTSVGNGLWEGVASRSDNKWDVSVQGGLHHWSASRGGSSWLPNGCDCTPGITCSSNHWIRQYKLPQPVYLIHLTIVSYVFPGSDALSTKLHGIISQKTVQ